MHETTGIAPFIVRHERDRYDAPVTFLNGRFDIKVSGRDTAGAMCVIDTIRTRPGGPPLHRHFEQDEWFFVTDGHFRFQVGDTLADLGPGDSIFGPRGIPHAFTCLDPTGRLTIVFQPAGSMEAFFANQLTDPRSEQFRQLSLAHGMEVVDPPLPLPA